MAYVDSMGLAPGFRQPTTLHIVIGLGIGWFLFFDITCDL